MRTQVLLITDSQTEREWIRKINFIDDSLKMIPVEYTKINHEPLIFYSRADGSQGFNQHDIALFLLDIQNNQSDAPHLLSLIKSEQNLKHLPVILIDDFSEPAHMHRLYETGASDLIQRDSRLEIELMPRIEAAIKRERNLFQLREGHSDLEQTARDLRTANVIFRSISIHDDLTGVPNRRFFDRYLDISWRQSQKSAGAISLIMIDVDYFKKYNDFYGHQPGDVCLRQVAGALETCMDHESYVLARYGGEEFSAILPGSDLSQARELAERMRLAVYELNIEHKDSDEHGRVTISQGIATTVPGLLMRPSQLIQKADRALYQAKAAGRNQVVA